MTYHNVEEVCNTCKLKEVSSNRYFVQRNANEVMHPQRLGALFSNRISFSRSLLRRLENEKWQISKEIFDLDQNGVGTAVYKINTPLFPVWFVAFANDISSEERNDRVIAETWDATFTLTTAEPTKNTLRRLRINIPLQERGRCTSKEIILSRANKSVRIFNYVIECLAKGEQPASAVLVDVGYLIRTTAVYGNGKFGMADFSNLKNNNLFSLPFEAEMLCVYLIRNFSFDWVEHITKLKSPKNSIGLADDLKKILGVGNSTGLGMAPFLIEHPKLICRWISVRESALSRVLNIKYIQQETLTEFKSLLSQALKHVEQWRTDDTSYQTTLIKIKRDLIKVAQKTATLKNDSSWRDIVSWVLSATCLEAQEMVFSAMIELYPGLVDGLEKETGACEATNLEPSMSIYNLLLVIKKKYAWIDHLSLQKKQARENFWYRSEEKEEPRLGSRLKDEGVEKELNLGIAFDVFTLREELSDYLNKEPSISIGEYLLAKPHRRGIIQRIQSLKGCAFAEIRGNLLDKNFRPIDLLRCKLAIFGATKFDPKSTLWLRVTLFQGAPLINQRKILNQEENLLFPHYATR